MVLPKKIKIAGQDVKVVPWITRETLESGHYGEFNSIADQMNVLCEGPKFKTLETFIHEMNHAMWYYYNVKAEDGEERIVHVTSAALVQVLRDNKNLRKYIREVFGD